MIPSTTNWEIRPSGSDANGGAFDPVTGSGHTDYSQQDAAQLSLTDVVTNGTTTVTSATAGFTTAMIGNGINIASDGVYIITARASSTSITVDRNTGTGSGQSAKVGGGLATPGYCASVIVDGNTIWWKAGATYTATNSANVSGGRVNTARGGSGFGSPMVWRGYDATHGDETGTRPTFQASVDLGGNSLFQIFGGIVQIENIIFDGNSNTDIPLSIPTSRCVVDNCKFLNPSRAWGVKTTAAAIITRCQANCQIKNAGGTIQDCYVSSNTVSTDFAGDAGTTFINCISNGSSNSGFDGTNGGEVFINCVAYGAAASGFSFGYENQAVNCIAYSCGAYGFNFNSNADAILDHCAGGNNTSGNVSATLPTYHNRNFTTLTGNPFTAAGSGDFSLNNTAGAGAACRASGIPGVYPGGTTTGYLDIGAAQHQDSGGGGAVIIVEDD